LFWKQRSSAENLIGSNLLEELAFIIGRIYDASIDPALWEAALAKVALSLGAFKSTLIIDNPAVKEPTVFASYESATSLRPADESAHERLALITPHMARAVAIGRALERAKLESQAFAEVLDCIQSAVLLVDEEGRIVHANRNARQYLCAGTVLRTAQGVLRMHNAQATAALDRAIASARDRTNSAGTAPVAIPLQSSEGERYFASVLPLTNGVHSRISGYSHAVVAVFIRRIGLDLPIDPVPLASAYGLTSRELTVMITVVESAGVPEAATVIGLSENTVRTHLQSIYRKTGARNQSELARLVASAGTGLH
jgi:DNA-binding CsgD family transcriptional regulator